MGDVYVDGIACGCNCLYPDALGEDDTRILKVFVDDTVQRDLMFARVQLSGESSPELWQRQDI